MTPEELTAYTERAILIGTRDTLLVVEKALMEVSTLDEARALVCMLRVRAEAEVLG